MKRYSDEERAEILKKVESVGNVHSICRQRGINRIHNQVGKGNPEISDQNSI